MDPGEGRDPLTNRARAAAERVPVFAETSDQNAPAYSLSFCSTIFQNVFFSSGCPNWFPLVPDSGGLSRFLRSPFVLGAPLSPPVLRRSGVIWWAKPAHAIPRTVRDGTAAGSVTGYPRVPARGRGDGACAHCQQQGRGSNTPCLQRLTRLRIAFILVDHLRHRAPGPWRAWIPPPDRRRRGRSWPRRSRPLWRRAARPWPSPRRASSSRATR